MEIVLTESQVLAIALVTLWTLPWKGYALWLASKRGEKWWFVILLLVNSLAILEIIYIFLIVKRKEEEKPKDQNLPGF